MGAFDLAYDELPPAIPVFPLAGVLLLPRGQLPLNIFEPRYLAMTRAVLASAHRLIGMIQPIGESLASIGTAGRVAAFSETEDGRVMISLKAVSRFQLQEVEEGFAPYLRGRVSWEPFAADLRAVAEEDPGFDREAFLSRLRRYMAAQELSTDWAAASEADDEMLINALAMLLLSGAGSVPAVAVVAVTALALGLLVALAVPRSKPAPGTAPSNLMLPGRYILQPEVMRALDAQEKGAGGEIQLTDAMARLIGTQPFRAYRFEGERYDCGSAAGFVIANLAVALERSDVAPAVKEFLSSRT